MSAPLPPLRGARRVHWTTLLGLVLVPLTVAGVLLWGLWNPTERLGTITAAVVNHDEPAEVDGQVVPLGRMLAGELIGDAAADGGEGSATNFTWVLTDAEDAEQGLENGDYATVVTIPENFSSAATSISSGPDAAEQARIDIADSDRGRLIDTALSGIVTQTATTVLNEQLGSQFVGSVFVGMAELHSGLTDAADGATDLARGGAQLSDGATQLADGTQQLAAGTGQLADGAGQLSSGAAQLAAGTRPLASGAGELAEGAAALVGGTDQLATGGEQLAQGASALSTGAGQLAEGASGAASGAADLSEGAAGLATGADQLAIGMRELATGDGTTQGLAGLATGVEQYTGAVNGAITGAQAGIGQALEPLIALRDDIADGTIPVADPAATVARLDALIEQVQAVASTDPSSPFEQLKQSGTALAGGVREAAVGADQLAGAAEALSTGAGELAGGAAALSGGVSQLANGSRALADQAPSLAGGAAELAAGNRALADQTPGLAAGAYQLAGGAAQLADQTPQLAAGASQLAAGTSQLAENTPELAQGASQLADGTRQSADGANELAKGLGQAVSGIPNYSETERDRIAEVAVAPVEAAGASDELFNASGVPLFAGIALWAGALASFLVLAPLWRRAREAARGVGWITLRSALPALGLGAVQGAIAGIVLPTALGYDFAQGAAFFGLALLAGVAFALVVQGLSALLGGFGRFVAFALLVVAFAVGVVSTVPGALAAVGDASPVGVALSGFQAVATGATGAGVSALVLALWGLGGLVLTALAVGRVRRAR